MADAAAKRHCIPTRAKPHCIPTRAHSEADIRKKVAIAAQTHLVQSWFKWCALTAVAQDCTGGEKQGLHVPTGFDDPAPECQGQFLNDWEEQLLSEKAEYDHLTHFGPSNDPFDDFECPFGMTDLDGNDVCGDALDTKYTSGGTAGSGYEPKASGQGLESSGSVQLLALDPAKNFLPRHV